MHNVYYGHELYHHGILKQKWGKRNGPPYPLKQSQKSSAEKKADGSSDSSSSSGSEKKESSQSASEKAKTMTDDELRAGKSRADLEADYISAVNKRDKAASGGDSDNNGGKEGKKNKKSYEFEENADLARKVEQLSLQNKYIEEKAKLTENNKSAIRKFVENYAKTKGADLVTDVSKKLLEKLIGAVKTAETEEETEDNSSKNNKKNSNSNNKKQNKKNS